MSYAKWRQWVGSLPWGLRWFVYLLLARPLIDLFWDLKDPILSVSLLHVVGILTPLLIVLSLISRKFPRKRNCRIDQLCVLLGTIIVLNATLIWFFAPSLDRLAVALKITLPIYLYIYFRYFVRSRRDLEGILQTFLFSAILPFSLLLFEIWVFPFRIGQSRGLDRLMAGYADVVSLGFYILLCFLIAGYFFMERQRTHSNSTRQTYQLWFVAALGVFALLHINHTASYATFLALMVFFFSSTFKFQQSVALMVLMLLGASAYLVFSDGDEPRARLVQNELEVWEGRQDPERAFHGRVSRWQRHWRYFTEEISLAGQMVGLTGVSRPYMTTSGPHNDFLRIIFTSGYIGLAAYLVLLFCVFLRTRHLAAAQRFLFRGMLMIVLLMSITTAPTFYTFVNYIFIAMLAYSARIVYVRKSRVVAT